MSTTTQSARDVAGRYFDALARRDLDAMGALWAPEGFEHIAGQADVTGPEGVRGYFGELFGAFPDFALRVTQVVAEGDRVAVRTTPWATHLGPFRGRAATGNRVEVEGIGIFRMRGGRAVERRGLIDALGFLRQLGATVDYPSDG